MKKKKKKKKHTGIITDLASGALTYGRRRTIKWLTKIYAYSGAIL